MKHKLIHADCLDWLRRNNSRPVESREFFDTVFTDPPDNIGLDYDGFKDKFDDYYGWCHDVLVELLQCSRVVWWSFNAIHTIKMACVVDKLPCEVKPCVQTFTFGQHRHTDLGNGHRPLWRLTRDNPTLYPDQIRVPSWRQLNGDKRADPRGCVPLDVFDFTRVTGNSKQRRAWHKTQLNEGLVERAVKLTTREGDRVLDCFGGTGTTLRVCKAIGRQCTLIEKSNVYAGKIYEEHPDVEYIRGQQ